MFPSNKQNKLRQTKKDETREENHWNYTTEIMHAFCFLTCFIFNLLNLLKMHKNVFRFVLFTIGLPVAIITQKGRRYL